MSAQLQADQNGGSEEVFEMKVESAPVSKPLSKALLVSIGVHVAVLASLLLVKFTQITQVFTELTSTVEEAEDPLEYRFDSTVTDQLGSSNVAGGGDGGMAATQAVVSQLSRDPGKEVERQVAESFEVKAPVREEIVQPRRNSMLAAVTTSGATENAGGVEGAVDRLAYEIHNSLREKKTMVIWLFDVSPSLAARREAIANRVENVYAQINALNADSDKALKSAVAVFGEKVNIVTPKGIDETPELIRTVRSIKSESSGKENTFNAVHTVANHFKDERAKRDVMLIVVTDEAGSDPQMLEKAISTTKRYGIRCFCVGDAAPFGRETIEESALLESGEVVLGVKHCGPESFFPERYPIGYFGGGGYDLENMSSGFGPYGLTRLCAETGGVYFLANSVGSKTFDPQVMRNYAPDYRPIEMLQADIAKNKAKAALYQICSEQAKQRIKDIPIPRTTFPADNDNVLRTAITNAQRPLAEFEYAIDEILRVLEPAEKDRAKIKDARSQAGFDLAIGRTLALRARAFGYNQMLAEMKSSPKKFEKPDSNEWRLVADKEIKSGPATKKLATRALEYLNRVVDDHPGTPWAEMAATELRNPLGWEWKESMYAAPAAGMGGGNEKKAGPKFIEVEDPVTRKKVKKQVDKEPARREI